MMAARTKLHASRVPRSAWRDVHGIVLLDKPVGLSSNQALQAVRRLFLARKGGHAGTLDPMASGLLPLCFGEATKLAGTLLGSRKAYVAECRLGVTTDTDDAAGTVTCRRSIPAFETTALEALLDRYRGRIMQVPPMYSALHQAGERLYVKARRGETVNVSAREVEIYRLVVLGHTADSLTLEVECGTGTYIRSLVRDLGEALGCGAHVSALRRTWAAPFRDPQMAALEALQQAAAAGEEQLRRWLLPVTAALTDIPRLDLDPTQGEAIARGQRVALAEPHPLGRCAAFAGGTLLALVEVDQAGEMRVLRGFNCQMTTS